LVRDTASPAILEARAWLDLYGGSRGSKIDLSQAAPPYSPPQDLLDRLSAAAATAEAARYGSVPGEYELRAAYARQTSELYEATIQTDQISITAGCNQAFLIAAMLAAKSGEAILLPVPWYFNHKMTLDMLGIEARALPCLPEASFVPDISLVESVIDEKVRAVVLVTPNNPTGAVYPPSFIEAVGQICRDHRIWLILDETYRDFRIATQSPHAVFKEHLRNNVISLYSFSKSMALPGYRLGAMIYPAHIAEHVLKVQDCVQICPARAGQFAVTWGLRSLEGWREERRQELLSKEQNLRNVIALAKGWKVESTGAYFAYVRHPFAGTDARVIARRLASRNGLLLIPGPLFGPEQEDFLRLSFGSLSAETIAALPSRLAL
jgi:aspartate/methionine/tyrosine aminotransferase